MRLALAAWIDKLPASTLASGDLFWARASEQLHPLNADLALELGMLLVGKHPAAALTAFTYATQHDAAEGHLGVAVHYFGEKDTDAAQAALNRFSEQVPLWRSGAERLLEPLFAEIYKSGIELSTPVRKALFGYSFAAFYQKQLLPAAPGQALRSELRIWYSGGMPSQSQPQIKGSTGVLLLVLAVSFIVGLLLICFGKLSPALLPLAIPYVVYSRRMVKTNNERKERRALLRDMWLVRDPKHTA